MEKGVLFFLFFFFFVYCVGECIPTQTFTGLLSWQFLIYMMYIWDKTMMVIIRNAHGCLNLSLSTILMLLSRWLYNGIISSKIPPPKKRVNELNVNSLSTCDPFKLRETSICWGSCSVADVESSHAVFSPHHWQLLCGASVLHWAPPQSFPSCPSTLSLQRAN